MFPATRPVAITATAVSAVILLTACTSSTPKPPPLEHGTVKKKDHNEARPSTPVYEDRYRETNCRDVTTNALALTGISRPSTGGRSTTSGGGGGGSKVKPGTPNKLDKGNSSGSNGSTSGGKSSSRRVCDRQYLGRVQTGVNTHPEVWKVQIVKGKRSNWKEVTETTWRKIKIGDRI
ncbi:hypothetical protein [Streptomyces sp. WM6378]|uniref:hypothetical protein n=1 Tax=Streptomyces sp. WM6378 TaxID=1415557 RepID=UPI0006B02362|nr:hypothetical protein [Streptomyces sp. WM6378]KOU50110.1 hypothetical protein ADK54_10170 [Streptomyces sp. WM6378]